MSKLIEPQTERLRLRQWRDRDREPFAAMSTDPQVMEFFAGPLSRPESDALIDRCIALIADRGWGFWAAERLDTGDFIGCVGLHVPTVDLPFSPCVEIGWRLARPHWGRGYATEAANLALKVGFETLDLEEIVSFAVAGNRRSRAVMERLGMVDTGFTFEHPDVPDNDGTRRHCLYKITRRQWVDRNIDRSTLM